MGEWMKKNATMADVLMMVGVAMLVGDHFRPEGAQMDFSSKKKDAAK